ncbi:MAG: hypothetical protein FJZ47_25890, partial [Candidatus Tectomicrobia bacterium]|nr:hypothetical protein [Candidatus Tectomicrobia bacterium]
MANSARTLIWIWTMAQFLDQKMLTGFVREAQSYLPQLREGVTQFQQDATQREALDEALRYAHTIKGAAAMVCLPVLSHLAYYVEATLEEVVSGQRPLDAPCHAWVYHVTEQLEQYLEHLLAGEGEQRGLVADIVRTFRRFQGLPEAEDAAAIQAALGEELDLMPTPDESTAATPSEVAPAPAVRETPAPTEAAQESEFAIDLLWETVAEEAAALAALPEDSARTIDMAMVSQDMSAL